MPGRMLGGCWIVLALAGVAAGAPAADQADQAAKLEFFEREVRPIFVRHCFACHSANTKPSGGLRVDDRNGLLEGGASGPAVVPGKPGEGALLARLAAGAKRRMPAEGAPLTDEQIATLTRWIEEGAVWPAIQVTIQRDSAEYQALRERHWAWQPLAKAPVPAVKNGAWPRDDVDRFLLARLEQEGLAPVADADPLTFLRRLTFDLTGLPPTPAEQAAFLADSRPQAVEAVIDRLLASPAFGEQWGRHWLDVARYAESTGPSRNIPYPHAWRYRDYVIDAINADMPFAQFVREQVAGDLLPARDDEERNRQQVATGFLALGVKDVNQRFPIRFQMDNVDEQIDVVTRSVLALTVSCARCHDHKFDPIPQADYYALAGIFTSTDLFDGLRSQMGGGGLAYYVPKRLMVLSGGEPEPDPAEVARLTAAVDEAKKAWDDARSATGEQKPSSEAVQQLRAKWDVAQAQLLALTDPAVRGLAAHGVRDSSKMGDTPLRVRGEAEKMGPVIPRGYLAAVPVPGAEPMPAEGSGRLELANWLTSDSNPLAARVFVNRVWAHLFGRGLVSTVDNFGVMGANPSHPELLDHLGAATVADGWSLKRLVRRLTLTRAYQLSAAAAPAPLARDPGNALVWRHAPRRLTADELRDALLASAESLDRARPEASPARELKMVELRDDGPEAGKIHSQANAAPFRSVYLPQLRGLTPQALAAFDPVEQSLVSGSREVTTVPGQALFLLNSGFVRRQAGAMAQRLLAGDVPDDERVQTAYRLALGRQAAPAEVARAAAFLADYAAAEKSADARTAAWSALAQALFASAEFRYLR